MNKKFILLLASAVLLSVGNLTAQAAPNPPQHKGGPNNAIVQPNKNITKLAQPKTNISFNTNRKLAKQDKKFNSIQKNYKGNRIVKYNNHKNVFGPREHVIGYHFDNNHHLKQVTTISRLHRNPNHYHYAHHYYHSQPKYGYHYNHIGTRHYLR